jgi:hypothetical protein
MPLNFSAWRARLCGLVVGIPGWYLEVPGSIPSATNFWVAVGLERGSLSLLRMNEELLERKSSGSVLENRLTAVGVPPRWLRDTPITAKVVTNIRRQLAVAQSVEFACGLRSTKFVYLFVCLFVCLKKQALEIVWMLIVFKVIKCRAFLFNSIECCGSLTSAFNSARRHKRGVQILDAEL